MATQNQVNIGINVSDNGTAKKTVKNFEEITKAANTAQKAASNINTPVGGTAGSRAAYSKAAPAGSQAMNEQEGTAYGRARAAVGTGAAGRDFANQAQGLGGFVRLYATLAANAFAAEAAFRALSNAMDTTNMIKGLDQLGAASGTALGSLSKQLVNTTGGAISLREAMEATAKASSSGMSSENILRMGKAAKQAAQALGVDMSDAVSRISRGITKLEPELLDELGIFVRVDDVVKKYAESTGKAASAVTDFEKRQAFANSVLDQAEKKFGAINLDTNPYTKLAATIADLAQSTFEFVNKGLTPLVSLLSSSPTALAVVLGGIAATLVKQAIPAISDFRAGLASAAEESKAVSQKKLQDVKSSLGAEMALRIQHLDDLAEAEFAKFETASNKLLKLKESSAKKLKGYDQKALAITQMDPVDITPEHIKYLEDLAKKETKIAAVYKENADAITSYKRAEDAQTKAQQDRNIVLTKNHELWTTIGQNEKIYHDEVNAARKRSASSQVAYTASTRGFMAGMREAVKEFSESKQGITTTMDLLDESGKKTGTTLTTTTAGLGVFSRGLNLAKNAAVGMTAALGTAINAFAPWLQIIGLVVAVGGALISWMSKTQEESAATSTALTGIKDSTKNLSDTIDVINKKSVLEQFDPKSVAAKATAVSGLTDQIRNGFEAAYKELDKMGTSDQFVNWVSKLWNGDVESELSDKVSRGLANVFKNIDQSSPAGKAAAKTLQGILTVDDLSSADAVNKALDSMSSGERRKALDLISASVKNLGLDMQISAARGTELVDAFTKAGEALTKFKAGFILKDSITEYGQTLVDTYFKLGIALNDPQQKLQAIKTLAEGIKNVAAPTDVVVGVQALSREIDNLNQVSKSIANIDLEISKLQDNLTKQKALALSGDSTDKGQALKEIREINGQLDKLSDRRKINVELKLDMTAQVNKTSELVAKAQLAVFKAGSELVASKLSTEWAKAGVTVTNAVASVLSGTETGIKLRAQAEKAMLNAQVEQIKVQRQQILATEANTLAIEQDRLDRDKQNMDLRGSAGESARGKIAEKQAKLDARRTIIEEAQSGKTPAKGTYAGMATKFGTDQGKTITSESLGLVQSLEGSAAQLANVIAQGTALDIGTKDQSIQLDYKKRAEALKLTLDALKVDQDRLAVSKELNSETNAEAVLERQALDSRVADLNYRTSLLAIEVEIARQKQVQKNYSPKSTEYQDIDKEITTVEGVKQTTKTTYSKNVVNQGLKNQIELIGVASKKAIQAANDQFVLDSRSLDAKEQQLSASEKLLEAELARNNYSAEFSIREKDALEQKKAQLSFDKETLSAKNAQKISLEEINRKEQELNAVRNARIAQFEAESGGFDTAVEFTERELTAQRELAAERTRVNDTYSTTTAKAQGTLNTLLQVLGITRETNLEQERYNQLLENSSLLATALGNAFGDLGTKLGGLTSALTDIAVSSEKGAKALADLEFDRDAENDPKKKLALEKEVLKQQDKNTRSELVGNAKIAGAAKSLFKEKTVAYKAFAAVEKGLQIASLALEMKTTLTKMGLWAAEVPAKATAEAGVTAAAATGAAARAPLTYGEIIGNYLAKIPAPFGMIAGVAAGAYFLSLFGKGSKGGGAFVPSAEQRQETQGTAMSWDSQGNKVQTSRGVFGDTSAKSESIANSLEIIRDNSVEGLDYDDKMLRSLQNLTTALDSTAQGLYGIKGLRAGSLSGVVEGTNTSGGLLGIGGLFSKSVTKSIVDSGIQLKGTFLDLVKGLEGTISTFETVSTTVKRSGFLGIGGGTSTSVSTNFKDLGIQDPKAFKSLVDAFGYASDLLYEVADTAGKDADAVTAAMSQIRVDQMASLRGLTGEQFTKELSAVIGSVLDETSLVIFAEYEKFAKFGEGMLETVIRVVDTNRKVIQQLENLGMLSIGNYSMQVTENLADIAGGLDKFLDQTNYFRDNFLIEAERLAPVQKAVTEEMTRLGYSSVDTREEFKLLVQSFDLTNPAVHETYQALMNVQEGFIAVTEAAVKEAEERKALEQKLFELTATKEQLRERELEGLFAGNRALQRQIWLVEEQSEILKTAATSFRDFSKQVQDFKSSLLLGASSTLTPGQKYTEAKTQFDAIYAQALAGDKVAMGKVTNSAQTFLEASKTYFASSTAYTNDFNTVLSKLDNASISAEASASVAELQLSTLGVQTTLLTSINANIATIAGVPQAAGGGRVRGLTLVGELGPELVDFTNPGQVYTAEQTAGMFAPKAGVSNNMNQVVQELRQVRQEIAQLRKDQQQQTGDLIVSNYDANNRAAEAITTEVANTATQKEWQQRNKVAVV